MSVQDIPGALGLRWVRHSVWSAKVGRASWVLAERGRPKCWLLKTDQRCFGRVEFRKTATLGAVPVLSGDPDFDGQVRTFGDDSSVRGLLSAPVRRAIAAIFDNSVQTLRVRPTGMAVVASQEWSEDEARGVRARLLELGRILASGETNEWTRDDRLLRIALTDPEVRVRAGAVDALLRIVPERSEAVVARWCSELAGSSQVRLRHRLDALWVLEARAPSLFPQVLQTLLGVPDLRLRSIVVRRVGELGINEALGTIKRFVHHPNELLASQAVRAYGQLNPEGSEFLLIERLHTGGPFVRVASADALGRVGSKPETVEALRAVGRCDGSPEVRRAAKQALRNVLLRHSPGSLAVVAPTSEGGLALGGF